LGRPHPIWVFAPSFGTDPRSGLPAPLCTWRTVRIISASALPRCASPNWARSASCAKDSTVRLLPQTDCVSEAASRKHAARDLSTSGIPPSPQSGSLLREAVPFNADFQRTLPRRGATVRCEIWFGRRSSQACLADRIYDRRTAFIFVW